MLTFTVTGIEDAIKNFDPSIVQKAVTRSLNELARKAVTATKQSIREKYNIKQQDLSENSSGHSRIKLMLASRGDNTATIIIGGRPISLAYFGAKQTVGNKVITAKKGYKTKRAAKFQGVTVSVLKGQPARLRRAFIAVVRAGKDGIHTGVFTRTGRGRSIMEKNVVTIATMFNNSTAEDKIKRIVNREFGAIFARNLDWYNK